MKIALKQARRIEAIYKRAHVYARRLSRDTVLAVLRAYENSEDVMSVLYGMLDILEDQTIDAMIAAHLAGYLRTVITASKHIEALRMLSSYTSAISFMQGRLKVPDNKIAALKARYGASAITMTQGLGDAVEKKTQTALKEIVARNYHVKEGVEHLTKVMKKTVNPWAIETIVRTQIQVAYGAGRWDANQDTAIQDILWGYEYVTAGDYRVRPNHEALEGTKLPKEDPRWGSIWPPNGMNCRCEALEIYKDEPGRMKVKEPAAQTIKGKEVLAEPDAGWAINHGQIYTSDISKTADEIQDIV